MVTPDTDSRAAFMLCRLSRASLCGNSLWKTICLVNLVVMWNLTCPDSVLSVVFIPCPPRTLAALRWPCSMT